MSHHTSACVFEIDELVAEMNAVRRQSRDRVAPRIVRRGRFDDRASVNDLLHQAQMFQHANRVCRKGDAGADFLQLRGALKNFDAKTRLPQSNGSSESPYSRADDENFRFCRHDGDRSIAPETPPNGPKLRHSPESFRGTPAE